MDELERMAFIIRSTMTAVLTLPTANTLTKNEPNKISIGTVTIDVYKRQVQDGWKALVQKNDSTKSDENVQTLPSVSVGDEMTVSGTEIKEGKTSQAMPSTSDKLEYLRDIVYKHQYAPYNKPFSVPRFWNGQAR